MDRDGIIEALLLWNFWEKEIDTGIPRPGYLACIKKFLVTDEVVVLTGVRRSGKSTILLQALSELFKSKVPKINTLYVNFEDPKFYNFLNVDLLDNIWQAYIDYLKPKGKVYLVLDEVQKVQGWEHWVRSKYDRKEDVKIFVTGSNAELLSPEFATVLTGRHFQVPVTPLSFGEFLSFKGIKADSGRLWYVKNKNKLFNLTREYLATGGFPKVVLTKGELLRKELLLQYFNDILTKDVVERYKIKDVSKLKNLALFYNTNFTRSYSFNKVKKVADFALSLDSVQRFSHYMENAFLISFLRRFSFSLRNQMQAQRKVYLVDNGMRNAVAFKFSEDKGKLLENAVYQQLQCGNKEIFYFSEKNEVDFVCKEGLKVNELYNVCYSLENKETLLREVSALVEAMKYFKLKESSIIIAEGRGEKIKEQDFTITIVPFCEWALQSGDK
ncbi:MAG: ATP-binding protein [Candidatus Omnitrophica bacterium]|nr:ATP-binding protein [Candidatus Omnitrophota bacterium]